MIDSLSPALPQAPDIPPPANAAQAATQFEAILLAQMLRAAHNSEDHEDQTGDTMWDVAAQQFAQLMAENGGLGLGAMIRGGLSPAAAREQSGDGS